MEKRKFRPKGNKPKYTAAQRAAYWIGVGASAERHNNFNELLDCVDTEIYNSCVNGYNDDNMKNVSKARLQKRGKQK